MDQGNTWAASLRGISVEQIKHGLNQCVLLGLEWPPSAPQFRNLCEGRNVEGDGTETTWQHKFAERAAKEQRVQYARNSDGEMVAIHPLPDLTGQEKAKKAGASALAAMKSLMGGAA